MSLQNGTSILVKEVATDRTNDGQVQIALQTRLQRQRQQKVRFNNIVTITEIPSHRIYTCDERIACWYTRSDFRIFSLENKINKKSRRSLGNKLLYSFDRFQGKHGERSSPNYTKQLLDTSMRVLEAQRLSQQRLARAQLMGLHYSIPEFSLNPSYASLTRPAPHAQLFSTNLVVPIKSSSVTMNEAGSPISPVARGA